jgi:hypothetical protein
MINLKDLESKSSADIGGVMDTFENELQVANHHMKLVKDEEVKIRRAMIDLRAKKADNDLMVNKAAENIKRLESDLRILRNAFFNAKRSGI